MKIIKNKHLLGAIFLTLFLIFSTTYVYASDFKLQINTTKIQVKPGETIDILLSTENLKGKSAGSNVFMCTLEYDKDVFEKIKEENIETLNNWAGFSYNEENGMMIANKMGTVAENEDIFKFHFTVKKDVENTITKIKIVDAKSAGDTKQLNADIEEIEIKVEKNNIYITIITVIVLFIIGEIVAYVIFKKNKEKGEK